MLKEHPNEEVVVLDKLTYAGRMENLEEIMDRITFVKGDICDKNVVESTMDGCDRVVNFAAESHVDRSITSPEDFVRTDVIGVFMLLEEARKRDIERFVQISTDEVYGSTVSGSFSERDILDPSSPYSASKAGGELLARSYVRTYGLKVMVTRSSNNYGPYQYPEKLIPVLVIKALNDQPLPIYGKGTNVRDWLHVEDNCRAVDLVLNKGEPGSITNIGSGNEVTNIEIAEADIKLAKGALQPTLAGFYQWNSRYSDRDIITSTEIDPNNPTRIIGQVETTGDNVISPNFIATTGPAEDFFDQIDRNKGYAFGLSLNIPILNGFNASNNVRRAKINHEQQKYQLEQEELNLERTIHQVYADAVGALKLYDATKRSLEAREVSFEYAQERFDVGVLNSFDFSQIKNRLVQANSDFLRAKYDFIFRVKLLEFYYGIPVQNLN